MQGLAQGMAQGLQQGLRQGVQQGVHKTALNALKQGYPIEEVSAFTDLSLTEIKELQKQIS
jgi:predicted transposase YdaD